MSPNIVVVFDHDINKLFNKTLREITCVFIKYPIVYYVGTIKVYILF